MDNSAWSMSRPDPVRELELIPARTAFGSYGKETQNLPINPPAALMRLIRSANIDVACQRAEECEAEATRIAREFFGADCLLFIEGGWRAQRVQTYRSKTESYEYQAYIVVWALGPLPITEDEPVSMNELLSDKEADE